MPFDIIEFFVVLCVCVGYDQKSFIMLKNETFVLSGTAIGVWIQDSLVHTPHTASF